MKPCFCVTDVRWSNFIVNFTEITFRRMKLYILHTDVIMTNSVCHLENIDVIFNASEYKLLIFNQFFKVFVRK